MFRLYHLWLSPRSRRVRLVLAEKGLHCETVIEKVWERREAFLAMNPAGDVPVLEELREDEQTVPAGGPERYVLADADAICEYLDETYPGERPLIGREARGRAECRRLVRWFDVKFESEVTDLLVGEKMMKRLLTRETPDSAAIRAGKANIRYHLEYIVWLTERRKWLGGEHYSMADIAAAAQLSCIDYIGDVPWDEFAEAKEWYARIKSRPAFRTILNDHIPGMPPPKHYADLDF